MSFINRLKQMAIFCQVTECGSMRAAADGLGMTPSAVSQHMSQLEGELGVTLIYRSTRKISLSEAGKRYYQHGKKMLMAAEDAEDAIYEIKHSIEGELRISAPVGLASRPLAQALKGLLDSNRELRLTVLAHDKSIDLVAEQVDLAIRVGEPESSGLIYHALGKANKHIYASTAYLQREGNPVTPEDLSQHDWLGRLSHDGFSAIELSHPVSGDFSYKPSYRMRFNDLNSLASHVEEGFGLAVLPELEVKALVEAGLMIRVLPDWQLTQFPLYALTIDRNQSYKVKAVLKVLKNYFA